MLVFKNLIPTEPMIRLFKADFLAFNLFLFFLGLARRQNSFFRGHKPRRIESSPKSKESTNDLRISTAFPTVRGKGQGEERTSS